MSAVVHRRRILRSLSVALAIMGGIGQAGAQTARPIGVDAEQPGRTIDRLQRSNEQTPAAVGVPGVATTSASADRNPLFKLQAVKLRGARSIPADRLSKAYDNLIGSRVSAADLAAVTDRLNDIYRGEGLHLSRAIIPPQTADGGVLVIDIVEGTIAEIKIRGGAAGAAAVKNHLAPLIGETPSRRASVERQLLLASDLPGVRIAETGLEEIGTASGRFRLVVDVEAWSNFTSVAFDNRGTNAVGPFQTYFATNFNSAFAPGDTLGVSLSATPSDFDELRFARVMYSAPVGVDGARWSVLALHSDVKPGDFRSEIGTADQADFVELRGTITPVRSRSSTLWLSAAISAGEYGERDVFGKVYADHLRIVTGSAEYQLQDSLGGWNYITANVKQGLDILGASAAGDPHLSRSDGSGEFTKLELYYSRIQDLTGPWSLKLAAVGQWASRPLLASQQFYVGAAFGRGFYGLEYSGDLAAAGSAELRFDQALSGPLLKGYQLYSYVDHTSVWNLQGGLAPLKLTLTGVGVRLTLPNNLLVSLEGAAPLKDSSLALRSQDPRVLFSLSKTYKLCPGSAAMVCG